MSNKPDISTFRIIQLIDSLEAGGAETMAVNLANALSAKVAFSGIVTTRAEGALKKNVDTTVNYLFLKKKSAIDFKAIYNLRTYCKINRISVLHAHSTSLFLAVLVKITMPKLKVIWHDHYGNSEFLNRRPHTFLRIAMQVTDGAIAVNGKLKDWITSTLNFSNTIFLPNFAAVRAAPPQTKLKGEEDFRIVCLANLREQKNHILLVEVAAKLKNTHPNWTFHFIGKDFNDAVSKKIRTLIAKLDLQQHVFLYGSCDDTSHILSQTNIAVLSSKSEGLPVALLEYGMQALPTLCTNVGEISSVIDDGKNGYLAPSNDIDAFYDKLVLLINDNNRALLGTALNKKVASIYSEKLIVDKYLEWLSRL